MIEFHTLNTRYFAEWLHAKATYRELQGLYRQHFQAWPQHPSRATVRQWHLAHRHHPGRANKGLGYLRAMYNWAIANDLWEGDNPTAGVKKHTMFSRDRTMSQQEVTVLMNALPAMPLAFRAILTVLITTGCRLSEARLMAWDDVNVDVGSWYKPHTKNGKPQRVPLPRQTCTLLSALKGSAGSRFVFTKVYAHEISESAIERMWRVMRRNEWTLGDRWPALRMPDVRLHDFRRTVATRLLEQGESDRVIKAILNHHVNDVTGIYARVSFDLQMKALQTHADRLFACLLTADSATRYPHVPLEMPYATTIHHPRA